jgi:integrase
MTTRLARALEAERHLRGPHVICQKNGSRLTGRMVLVLVKRAARRAGLTDGSVHTLRHTFCSHLAMKGAPPRAIQESAGHRDLSTTQRYLRLGPGSSRRLFVCSIRTILHEFLGGVLERADPGKARTGKGLEINDFQARYW